VWRDQVESSPNACDTVNFRDRAQNVVHMFDDMDGSNFVKTTVRERQGMIQIGNDVCPDGIPVPIHSDRPWSFIEATA